MGWKYNLSPNAKFLKNLEKCWFGIQAITARLKKMVCAIIPYRHEGSVITRCEAFEYCAEIPKKTEPRRATNRELARWLAQGNGEYTEGIEFSGKGPFTKTTCYYDASLSNNAVKDEVKVRKWDDTEWHEPTVDYMGIWTNAGV